MQQEKGFRYPPVGCVQEQCDDQGRSNAAVAGRLRSGGSPGTDKYSGNRDLDPPLWGCAQEQYDAKYINVKPGTGYYPI